KGPVVRWTLGQPGELRLPLRAIVAELTGATEGVAGKTGDGGEAPFVLDRYVGASLLHPKVVEQIVGKVGPRVTGDASALPDEKLGPTLRLCADCCAVAGDKAVKRCASANQQPLVGLRCFAKIRQDSVHDELISRRHHFPRAIRIAWPRFRPPRRRKTSRVLRVRIQRGIQPWGEDGAVLSAAARTERVAEPSEGSFCRGPSPHRGAGLPSGLSPAVAVEPGVENIVHQRGCIARLKSVRARRHVAWIGA